MLRLLCFLTIVSMPLIATPNDKLVLLEESVAKGESKYTDIVASTEKYIRWHGNTIRKSDYVIIYIHGFSASRMELSPTTELLADKIGANVFYTRLTGHGRSDDAMADATVDAWKQDALESYSIAKQMGKKIILISVSTGGTLATWLQGESAIKNVVANIMISPNFGVKSSSASILLWPGGITLAKWISGDYRSFTPLNEKHARYWTERYPIEAVIPMLRLVKEVGDIEKSKIKIPQLFVYSPRDQVIDVEKIESTMGQYSPDIVSAYRFETSEDPAQHVLAGDACAPKSTEKMVKLLEQYILGGFSL